MLDEMLWSQMVLQVPDTVEGNEKESFLDWYRGPNVIDPKLIRDAAQEAVDAVRKQRARDYRLEQEWRRKEL